MIGLKHKVVSLKLLDQLDNQMTEWLIVEAFNNLIANAKLVSTLKC